MAKLISIILIVAAIALAAIYLIRRRKISDDDVSRARGWRRHVLIGAAMVLALLGVGGCSGDPKSVGAGGNAAAGEDQPVGNAWARLRTAWRQIDDYTSDDFRAEQKAKKEAHKEAIDELLAQQALPEGVAGALVSAFDSTVNTAVLRPAPMKSGAGVECYKPTTYGAASFRAAEQIVKATESLAEFQKQGKLAPAVAEKARANLALQLRIVTLVDQHAAAKDDDVRAKLDALARTYLEGKPLDEPLPDEVKQAADVLVQLLTSDEPPVIAPESAE
ncbi:MAG TPA: hypothetical protein VM223_14360 [Planctomycetota bacterium]|nr:hypothetical protein [Planctomycetota bacterium]